jgi:uncharacterized protein
MSTIVLDMRTSPKLIGDLLFGQTRGGVLMLLFSHPDEAFYVRQIARRIGISVGIVQRELETLHEVQLVIRSKSGNQIFYRANRDNPVFPELNSLISKTIGIFQMLHSALVPLEQKIVWAFVYGSVAKQEERAESDVDLMIIGDASLDEVLQHLAKIESASGRQINPTVYTVGEFKSKETAGNHFLAAVLHGKKVTVMGKEDELRKVG